MRTLILAAMALAFAGSSAMAECNWMQTAAKSSTVAQSDQGAAAQSTQPKSPAS